ncbi:CRISPR-associated endonuclease Cas3'' [Dongia soli]|uniref:CRISPR-associated endonuclease Cas3 n=1 Tax=Dongia soli TaxID=600628 RepID=A0ABU5EHF2_9PROT|nr:CRISPR-associated endonuclease Cas3'' [Dongia soli]MDY0885309.1 CRISPR-associated endonuclease Cas3'' [Dongia soli]
MYYAHSTEQADRSDWHVLQDHLTKAAALAGTFAERFGSSKAATLAGLLHDLGKYNPDFARRLEGAPIRVDHSTAGAAIVRDMAKGDDGLIAELIAYGIAGHHAGLPDRLGDVASLESRIAGFDHQTLDPIWRTEIYPDATGLLPSFDWQKDRLAFQLSLLGRMIFSCLVDADFKDTEKYYASIGDLTVDRDWPFLQEALPRLIAGFDRHMQSFGRQESGINRLRSEILDHVRAKAGDKPGLFTLTVPTGGGKTLASLGFALDHARRHGHRRIIYAIPYTAIIDQTARIFQSLLGEDIVLEHHSAIEMETLDAARPPEGKGKLRLAMEDWSAPVVVTTNVQLFESLYAARPARVRKLHNIAGSIIILDEAQTLPRPLLTPVTWMLEALARDYGCTIVLCTATQPALDKARFPAGHPTGLDLQSRELAPDPARLAAALKRVTLRHGGAMTDDDLIADLAGTAQGLVIVNSRKHALALFRAAWAAGLDGAMHLTTRLYPAHRRDVLDRIKQSLANEAPCRLIATSLVEAGVDLDFPRVWRAEAGLDQIAQAAGRCNREGKRPPAESLVTVFSAPVNPPPREIAALSRDMARMMDKHEDLFSPQAMADFFGEVYWRVGADGLDAKKILPDFRIGSGMTNFAYRSVAEKFRMIDSTMVPVIIARDELAREAVKRLAIKEIPSGKLARQLQPYTVQIPSKARARLQSCGHVSFIAEKFRADQFAVLQTASLYDPEVGLLWEDAEYLGMEDTII